MENKEIYPVLDVLCDRDKEVYALIAPAFVGQFGKEVTVGRLRSAFKRIGFQGMVEVAAFADILTFKGGRFSAYELLLSRVDFHDS